MTELTHEELTRLLDYDPETGVFRWRVDRPGGVKSGDITGNKVTDSMQVSIKGKRYNARKLAWFYQFREYPKNNTFPKNGDRYDNRINNIGVLPDKPKTLTHEYLKQCIDYNPDTGEFKWKITEGGNVYGCKAYATINCKGFYIRLVTGILGKRYSTTRLIVFWMTGYMPSPNRVVMPIDNNCLNLKWNNIKVGTMSNATQKQRNKSGYTQKGVSFNKESGDYRAQIQINGKRTYLGSFKTEAEAHAAYMKPPASTTAN